MIFIPGRRGPAEATSPAFQGPRTGERDRATSANLSARRNFEDGLLSKAYVDCVKTVRQKSAIAGSSGIINGE
jgi:hypothetical protein